MVRESRPAPLRAGLSLPELARAELDALGFALDEPPVPATHMLFPERVQCWGARERLTSEFGARARAPWLRRVECPRTDGTRVIIRASAKRYDD